jgi:two-component system sensor histidine kinase RegB
VTITVDARAADDGKPKSAGEPVFERNPAITYGLGNLIENAADFATTRVDVEARWSASDIIITVRDDGPGFSQDIIDRLGDPFVTSRKGYGPGDLADAAGRHEGMGLGFFIAKTLLERSGAQVALANRGYPDHGASVRISWPRPRIDVALRNPAASGV